MSTTTMAFLSSRLENQRNSGLYRELPARKEGLVDFSSNDYLGLARSEELASLITEKAREVVRNGSTGSRLLTGNDPFTEEVESELARLFLAEKTLIFNSGYAANLAVLSSLPTKDDTIIYDERAHASIKDGARLSLARRFSFRHNDLADLERKIKAASGKVYLVAESVYSMDGDSCPLEDLIDIAERYDACLVLDEAHSTGVMGNGGNGMAANLGVAERVPVRVFTFGKAMGIHGACVAGSELLREYLVNFARPFIYTTAPDRHTIASIHCAFEFLGRNIHLQRSLERTIRHFAEASGQLHGRSANLSPIQTITIPGPDRVRKVARMLQDNGMDVRPIVSPTVPKGAERLRICLHVYNTKDEITRLRMLLKQFMADE